MEPGGKPRADVATPRTWLGLARQGSSEALGWLLETYRTYLTVVARSELAYDTALQRRIALKLPSIETLGERFNRLCHGDRWTFAQSQGEVYYACFAPDGPGCRQWFRWSSRNSSTSHSVGRACSSTSNW